MLVARVFIGIPEVRISLLCNVFAVLELLIDVDVGGLLPRWSLSPFPMVHQEGELAKPTPLTNLLTSCDQELSFRSAIFYAGLMVSNAFGSVRLNPVR